jgi:hypothetical protein
MLRERTVGASQRRDGMPSRATSTSSSHGAKGAVELHMNRGLAYA